MNTNLHNEMKNNLELKKQIANLDKKIEIFIQMKSNLS